MADTIAADRSLHGATDVTTARRTAARIDATASSIGVPCATTSISLSLFTEPTSDVPRLAY
jgi:hypothetical protein